MAGQDSEQNIDHPTQVETLPNQQKDDDQKPKFVINRYSWSTPFVGLVMLVIGLFGGVFVSPFLSRDNVSSPTRPAIPTDQSLSAVTPTPTKVQAKNPNQQDLMTYLVNGTRHLKGASNASVTLIEFSDFQ